MSTRAVVEINHDFLHRLLDDPVSLAVTLRSICCDHQVELKDYNVSGRTHDEFPKGM